MFVNPISSLAFRSLQVRKRFGQHFLHDQQIIQRIVDQFHPRNDEKIVEIGPGRGALTETLLQRIDQLHAIEIDRDLIGYLSNRFSSEGLMLHQVDILNFDFAALVQNDKKLRLIGNLPYNISTPLLFHLVNYASSITDMCFMLQKEVVTRLTAQPGNKDYGRLTVMMGCHCAIEHILDVPPESFTPPPKVDSSVVRIIPHARVKYPACETPKFAQLVKRAFNQRRKTLRNSLKDIVDEAAFFKAGIDSSRRPEQLAIEEFARLAESIG